jgi:hypothetical protein
MYLHFKRELQLARRKLEFELFDEWHKTYSLYLAVPTG